MKFLLTLKIVLLFESTISGIKITATSEKILLQEGGGGSPKIYVVFRGGQAKIYANLQGGRGGSKCPKIDLRRIWMSP